MIEHRVGIDTLAGNPVLAGARLMRDLKDVGVPVTGVLWPHTVSSGKLVSHEDAIDAIDGVVVYQWFEDGEALPATA